MQNLQKVDFNLGLIWSQWYQVYVKLICFEMNFPDRKGWSKSYLLVIKEINKHLVDMILINSFRSGSGQAVKQFNVSFRPFPWIITWVAFFLPLALKKQNYFESMLLLVDEITKRWPRVRYLLKQKLDVVYEKLGRRK
jgi:hypothetical protein